MVNILAATTQCGGVDIPNGVFNLVHLIILLIQIAVPVMLIIWGMLDFAKAVVGGDDDKIKAGQKTFVKRLVAALIVFLVVTVTILAVNAVSTIGGVEGDNTNDVKNCINNFVNGVS